MNISALRKAKAVRVLSRVKLNLGKMMLLKFGRGAFLVTDII